LRKRIIAAAAARMTVLQALQDSQQMRRVLAATGASFAAQYCAAAWPLPILLQGLHLQAAKAHVLLRGLLLSAQLSLVLLLLLLLLVVLQGLFMRVLHNQHPPIWRGLAAQQWEWVIAAPSLARCHAFGDLAP
jgi:hypothetical protein